MMSYHTRVDEDTQPDGAALGDLLRRYARGVQRLNVALAKALGIPPTDVWALEHLLTSEPLGPVELGHRLGIRSASATSLVDRLERGGHVERRRHDADRRRLVVVPTQAGAEAVVGAFAALGQALDDAGDALDPAGRVAVARYLRDVTAAVEAYVAAQDA
jgi:DNA-binding MarR family transcriptional regulator